ncbi:fibronectin type 3 and ankyrin repeat domains protein 1-like isoform X2 [Zootermopsis nevadensis]|uniref:fibronectin type 3 and ankyrin repeat domains protein 1-like isoform X2 n=1 Tax=Zootermopsis nevadensis TaxID=136037 RepID=UPI000B8E9E33|nr:fibronectin type 3 and ankyrin repeat domains protein 1-like isoform X2 [Zootermopsis nevadensis]
MTTKMSDKFITSQGAMNICPPRLRVLSSTPSSIMLSWDETEGPSRCEEQDEIYRLQYTLQIKDRVQGWVTVYWGFQTKFEVTGLGPLECYQFKLKVTTPEGDGPWSPQIAAATKEGQMAIVNLFRAIQYGQPKIAKKNLTNRYGSVEVFNSMGMSPLMQAASLGDPEMVNLMLSAGADVNLTSKGVGRTALMIVCFKGDAKIAHQLIERGANWDIRDRNGCTALHYAVDGSEMETVEMALDEGADIEAKDVEQWTPLMRGVILESSVQILKKLLERGATPNCVDRRGQTCLMQAVLSGCKDIVKLLVDSGADLVPCNVYHNTALDMACARDVKKKDDTSTETRCFISI